MAILTVYDNQGNAIEIPALRGQRGPTGPTGLTGAQGPQGETGATGPQGKSAYQVAVDNGFIGTESEWLASLKGDPGEFAELGPISLENTTAPPSGADVAEALANAAPNLTPENYLEITEETTDNPGEEETITKIRTTIGNIARHQEYAYDDMVITVDEADYSYVHELPVISAPTNYNLDKIRLIGEEFDTGFQSFTNIIESKTNTIPFVSGDFDKITVNSANVYSGITFYNQNDMTNGVGNKFKSQGTLIIAENENDTPISYTLEKETTLRFRVPPNLQGTETGTMIEQQVLPSINEALDTGDPSSLGMEGGTDCALFFSNIYNKQEALDAALLCLINASSSVDSNFVLTPIIQTAPMFMYLAVIGKNSNVAVERILGLFTDLNLENYYLVQESLTQNQLSYFKYNTTTTADSMMNDDTTIVETNSDEPAFLITFDGNQAEIISSRNLKYQNLQIILDKVGKIQWPGETIEVGPHLEVRNNKIDFPYGQEFITFKANDIIKCDVTYGYSQSNDNSYYYSNITLNQSQYTLSNTNISDKIKMVCKIKTLGKIDQNIIEWKLTQKGNYLFTTINNNSEKYVYEEEYFNLSLDNKLKIGYIIAYNISDSSLTIKIQIPSEQLSNPSNNLEINFGDYIYGTKKISPELIDIDINDINTTNLISSGNLNVPTSDAVYNAINNLNLFSGDYNDLSNKPTLSSVATTGDYTDLINIPTFSNVASTGDYADLSNKPTLFSGDYTDLSNKPTLFSGNYADLNNKPTLATVATSGDYADLSNKPTLFSGDYEDLDNKPTLFSGDYEDLDNLPSLATVATSGDYSDLSNKPTLATVATSGDYTDLSNTPTIPSTANDVNAIASSALVTSISSPTDAQVPSALAVQSYVTSAIAGLSGAMHFRGVTTTSLSNGSSTSSITIGADIITAAAGDVVLNGDKEFVYTGSAWYELGDQSSWVPKSRTINGTNLQSDVTLYATDIALNSSDNTTVSAKIGSIETTANAAVPNTRKINNNALSGDITLNATQITMGSTNSAADQTTIASKIGSVETIANAAVPNSRKINNTALNSDITLNATQIPISSASGANSIATVINNLSVSDINGALSSSDIANFPNKPSTPTAGYNAVWDSNGNLANGCKIIIQNGGTPATGTANNVITFVY